MARHVAPRQRVLKDSPVHGDHSGEPRHVRQIGQAFEYLSFVARQPVTYQCHRQAKKRRYAVELTDNLHRWAGVESGSGPGIVFVDFRAPKDLATDLNRCWRVIVPERPQERRPRTSNTSRTAPLFM
jgi:hypothetical protein